MYKEIQVSRKGMDSPKRFNYRDKVEDLLSVPRRQGIVIPSASCRHRAGFMVRLNTFIMLVLKLKVREEVNLNT